MTGKTHLVGDISSQGFRNCRTTLDRSIDSSSGCIRWREKIKPFLMKKSFFKHPLLPCSRVQIFSSASPLPFSVTLYGCYFIRAKDRVSHPLKKGLNKQYVEILHNIRLTRWESLLKNGLSLSSRHGLLNSIENNSSSVAGHPNLSPAPDHEFASRWYICWCEQTWELPLTNFTRLHISSIKTARSHASLLVQLWAGHALRNFRGQDSIGNNSPPPLHSLLVHFPSRASVYTEGASYKNVPDIRSVQAIIYLTA
jgi:hypothetical protein